MGTYQTIEGNLLDYTDQGYILHACNCKGEWGPVIASQIKVRFPKDYEQYREACFRQGTQLLGKCLITDNVISLFTSKGYGRSADDPSLILINTASAIGHCLNKLSEQDGMIKRIFAPKINSGMFRTPWSETELIIRHFIDRYIDIEWNTVILPEGNKS